MSVEKKIRELMQGKTTPAAAPAKQLDESETFNADSIKKDTSIPAQLPGDAAPIPQGSSADASYEEREEDEENQGAVASGSTPTSPRPQNYGPGGTPDYKTVGDPTSVVNMPGSRGNVPMESVDIKTELAAILGEDASDEFKTKATSLFEAAVVARVNSEMDKIVEALEAKKEEALTEAKEQLVEKVDAYLSYVVEQWMEENRLAVDTGLRSEIAEDFISGLKTLFKEHYIEIPEDKYDVVAETQAAVEAATEKLNEAMNDNVELRTQLVALKKAHIFEKFTKDLASTEAEKLQKLVEGVEFDNEELYSEKISLIKETHFPKNKKGSSADQLTEDITSTPSADVADSVMSRYAQAISRGVKSR